MLMKDPTSWLAAAKSNWNYPVSREWIVTQDLYNMTLAINSKKKPKPYPTPWKENKGKRVGKTSGRSQQEILKRLEKMNPKEPAAS